MRGWRGTAEVIRWEIMRNLSSRAFLIGVVLTPVLTLAVAAIPALLGYLERPDPQAYAVVDRLGVLADLDGLLPDQQVRLVPAADAADAEALVQSGEVDGYLVLGDQFVQAGEVPLYVTDENRHAAPGLQPALTRLLQSRRLAAVGLRLEEVEQMLEPAVVVRRVLGREDEAEEDLSRLPTAIGFVVLLTALIMTSGIMLLQSTMQERRDRMSEVVLSSINAQQFMAGKIIGHFLLGALQALVWLAVVLPVVWLVLNVDLARWVALDALPLFALFFLLGYLMYAALFVSAGATMEDVQGSGNLQGMVFLLPFLPFLVMGPVTTNPTGVVARVATLFPLTSPGVAVVRIGMGSAPAWEIAASALLLLLTAAAVTFLAARVFRTGMLMYGKTATPAEIWRWLRAR